MSVSSVRGPIARPAVRQASAKAAPAAPARTTAAAPKPAAPNPDQLPLKAGSALLVDYYLYKAYKTSKENAAGFKAAIALYAGALNESRVGAEAADAALANAKAAEAKADAQAVAPYNASKAAHAAAHAKYQAPVDALNKQLRQAWIELDAAVHPGRPEADARDGEAAQVRAQITGLDASLRDLYAKLGALSPYSSSYGSAATSLRDQIRGLEDQERPLVKRYLELSDKADAARGPQAAPTSEKVKAARAKVSRIQDALEAAQATYRTETDKTLLAVDRAQQTYNRAMAEFRGDVVAAEGDRQKAQALFAEVQQAYADQEPKFNVFKRLGWKLFNHLDAHALWESEKRKALNLPEPAPKK